jgi:hypothetical protein
VAGDKGKPGGVANIAAELVMSSRINVAIARILAAFLAVVACSAPLGAAEWHVARSTGDVWVASLEAQPVSLGVEVVLRPGDKVQTGRTGRVLLVRGTETILVAPNSVVSLPAEQKAMHATTILHQAGSIMLEVEKKGVDHFEVETPFLAAVVKGTRFSVTVSRYGADVRVLDGKVHVADFKSGQFALVSSGQTASVASLSKAGLSLGGPGQLGPVQHGAPRKSQLQRVPVPARGLGPPRATAGGTTHAAAQLDGRVRIVAPIGLGNLNMEALTNGLARGAHSSPRAGSGGKGAGSTVWGAEGSGVGMGAGQVVGAGNGNAGGSGNGGGLGNANANANGKGAANGKAKGKNK